MDKKADDSNTSSALAGTTTWFCGLVLGIFGGATVALLTAPKSGSEVRDMIGQTAKDVPNRLRELIDDSLDLYASVLNYGQLIIEEQAAGLKRAIAAGKLAAAKKREELELGGSALLPFQHR